MPGLDDVLHSVNRAVILGVGDYGSGADAAVALRFLGLPVTATDSRPETALPPEHIRKLAAVGVPLLLGCNPEWLVDGDTLLVPAPSVPLSHPLVKKARCIFCDVALLAGAAAGRVIGVTGSNGKTTTAAWLHHVLRQTPAGAALGGNIGVSAGRLLAVARRSSSFVVLEISSFQAEYLVLAGVAPSVMVFTNFSPNHLDHYCSLDAYRSAKRGIIPLVPPSGALVLNSDDEVWRWREGFLGRVLAFGRRGRFSDGVFFGDEIVYVRGGVEETLGPAAASPLPGDHNLYNLCAVLAAAAALGVAPAAAFRSALSFPGVEHRLEKVASVEGVVFYDDSSSTTPESTLTALAAFAPPPVLIVGGRNKGMPLDALAKALAASPGVVLIGETTALLLDKLSGCSAVVATAADMRDAVAKALAAAMRAGTRSVVLSPGFASFDMFRNYRHRGDVFKDEVRELAAL
ncbi:MAG TPA: UDP-N-acetylmuramoyl-L-alanine--D-glutamate ligase [Planctomycetes bacterium]|nr:UDP-N-acetylmuramoyl-L-alanine--D-glutamate ligase [Planctomycetota bacterium]